MDLALSLDAKQSKMLKLLRTGEYSDMRIVVGEAQVVFQAHKAIVCTFSDYFRAAFSHDMRGTQDWSLTIFYATLTSYTEARDNVIEFPTESPHAMRAVLEYLYCGTYGLLPGSEPAHIALYISHFFIAAKGKRLLEFHRDVLILADSLLLPGLAELAATNFLTASDKARYSHEFARLAVSIYETVPAHCGIRASLNNILAENVTEIVAATNVDHAAKFWEIADASHELSSEMFKYYRERAKLAPTSDVHQVPTSASVIFRLPAERSSTAP